MFDFDGTLTRRDTLLPFLSRVRGPVRLALDLCLVSPWLAGYASRIMSNTLAKEALLRQCLGGMTMADLQLVAETFARVDIPGLLRSDTMDKLRQHQDKGDCCVLVSASLSLYLEPWGARRRFQSHTQHSVGVPS
ncbi:MAG: haloacid dehalogenase-like hydrolase [Hydrogenophilales bacterium]|nr:haloacid dehalogenase-like hydrolase [Hydrogenophilales bacterium]